MKEKLLLFIEFANLNKIDVSNYIKKFKAQYPHLREVKDTLHIDYSKQEVKIILIEVRPITISSNEYTVNFLNTSGRLYQSYHYRLEKSKL